MKVLDLDMDYFMDEILYKISEDENSRPDIVEYGDFVWSEKRVRSFIENNLGLSKKRKIKGRIVSRHNMAISFWNELILKGDLKTPFEVIHVDSHADLGIGYSSWKYIIEEMLRYTVNDRQMHNEYLDTNGKVKKESIGDYLLFAIAYQWISNLTFCANPFGKKYDYPPFILKDFTEKFIWEKPIDNIIQLVYNPNMKLPKNNSVKEDNIAYLDKSVKDPEVPFKIIQTVEDVRYKGEFDFLVMAQSPNYIPENADFIIDILKEYIVEC